MRRVPAHPDQDERLSVLMVTPRSPLLQGGVERHVTEVSSRIAAAGAEVEVVCGEPGGPKLQERSVEGVPLRIVRAWPPNRDYYLAPGIWREIGRRRWDVVHVQSYHTLIAPLAMLRALALRVPYVVTFHGGGNTSGVRNRLRPLQRILMRPLLARAARLVAVARFEIEQYGRELRLPPEKFVLIPNGTDLAFSEAAAAVQPAGPPTIATIGRLERYKGHHRVIAAFPTVLARQPGARLLVIGTGPYEPELRRQAAELGISAQVEFTSTPAGDPGAMATLLKRVSLVVLMSEFETHPLVALESAAAGRRLLVADAGGLAELAQDGFARAIPLDEPATAIGGAILEELSKPPGGRRPKLTTWDECAAELCELYRSIS